MTVITFPFVIGFESVKSTFVPVTETELTGLTVEFTWTRKAEKTGTMFARTRL